MSDESKKQWGRADFCKDKLQQLNLYVKVSTLGKETNILDYITSSNLKVVINSMDAIWSKKPFLSDINNTCR